jgi:Succinylglutamate desuccinylase
MKVYELGEGTPEVAVVGGIHGDEPCGPLAIKRLLAEELTVERPVKLIIANEEALEAGQRYLEADLNRVFPGDPNADAHEADSQTSSLPRSRTARPSPYTQPSRTPTRSAR